MSSINEQKYANAGLGRVVDGGPATRNLGAEVDELAQRVLDLEEKNSAAAKSKVTVIASGKK